MGRLGVTPRTTLVLYGDMRNWFAAFAFWTFRIHGHCRHPAAQRRPAQVVRGGPAGHRGRPHLRARRVPASRARGGLREFLPGVRAILGDPGQGLVDVRSPAEFSGAISAPPEYQNEGAQRAGHIPGAVNIPWSQAIQDDDTFKPPEQLRDLYQARGVTPDKRIVTYCRIGERSSHTWFVLTYLLGYPRVANYDGSWSEWGNAVGVPVERAAT